ncbi:hypothetical protein A2865_00640 [Candidatus Woesebacteria bacterium RIFCSPHIGHO2_01_FULL_39_17]|uniref:Uncharacterized protein n=1 Tax=Candidatus Woesebacteria bacterium GW2011_GWA1_39_21b TaxID=1618551 RepID=A0A0G0NBD8_9BACT|nr:MAG: hypothetical protein US72_C0013G0024 [Microgenomates group bacterium GW2011_GWC1_38_12]KKR13484.1 MAG: hypothetical protein UT40_C0016G0015 [Candidatus Woesebacteria bacterium GW2011_GWA1_39_21b]OGM22909.1 MAG: hypothetical protein A2865_00640 [Candidatus Woesebacteria bacterium RIFCSPHIGHO2_01_FULL_39_17]
MVKQWKDKVATETFVYRLFNQIDEKIENFKDELNLKLDEKFNKVMEHLVDIAGQFKKFDEERIVMSGILSEHIDRIEKLEQEVFKTS